MDDTEINIRAILELLQRRAKLILVTVLVVVTSALLYAFSLVPTYNSSALVLVDTRATLLLDPTSAINSGSSDNARVDSEVEIMRSDNVLLDVIALQDLVSHEEFGVKLGWRDQVLSFFRIEDAVLPTGTDALQSVLSKLRNAVSIERKGLTYLISVSATSESPAFAATLANSITEAYIDAQVRSKVENTLTARNILQARITEASAEIVAAEGSFDRFIYNNVDAISLATGRVDIGEMQSELNRLSDARDNILVTTGIVSENISLKNWVAVAQSLQDEAMQELNRQRVALRTSLSALADGSQASIDLRTELSNINSELLKSAERGLSALRQSVVNDQARESDLRQTIRASVVSSNLPADLLAKIFQLQQNGEIARNQYQTLIVRVRELEAQAQTQIADSRLVSAALPPAGPSFPNKKLILALAGIASLGLGIGLALLYENFLGGFTSEGQIQNVLKTRVIASVPHISLPQIEGKNPDSVSAAELMLLSPLSPYAESIRRIRAAIDTSLRRKENRPQQGTVIMISSSVPSEGKSTISLSLGRSYALSGKKTVLIDCDLRKPSLHKYLNVNRTSGLAEYLANPEKIELLQKTSVIDTETTLSIIVGSKRSDMPTDHFSAGSSLETLINSAKKQFDYIILDTPPIIPVVDGLYLAEYADIVAMVVRWASTSQGEAKETVTSLTQVLRPGTEIITIMNQQENNPRGYRYKYSGYYGAY